ncbi:MAG: T9SS type A sorting domain-containing protein [Bacteroidetes bacterium]|nr:T9SS type A sorting domain-containing protein [Bacteroidota bacterium]
MKKFIPIFFLMAFMSVEIAFSQEMINDTKPIIKKATYFDKTPPLRNMKIILPGERDRSWKDNEIQNEDRDETMMYSSFVQPEVDMVQQTEMGSRNVTGPLQNFAGVGRITALTPPDTDGDVGPDHYFQMVNVSFAIWDKQGNLLYGPVDNSTLWDGFVGPWTGTNDGDPVVIYDELEDRWVATQFAINTNNGTYWELIAVSETPDPTGAYYRYAFQYSLFNDYPKFSNWPDAYYATYNMFAGGYAGATIVAFEKDSMLVGSPNARMVEFGPYTAQYGTNTADFDGTALPPAGSPQWVVNLNKYNTQSLEVYKFTVDWSNPASSTFQSWDNLPVTAFSFFDPNVRPQLPQPNSSQLLDPLSKYSMYPLKYRNFGTHESMTINHTVKLGTRAGVRWYELRKDASQDHWYIYQEGTYAPNDGLSRWMASMAMNANGDIALGYSVTSADVYPGIRYTGRSASTPLGQMDVEEVTIVEGSGSQSGSPRWGDYSYMSVDPSDDLTFWYTQEYIPTTVWGTRIASFDLGPLQPPTANAGEDSEICSEEVFYGQGSATSAQSVEWVTTGDGTLMFANTLQPAYIRGTQDLENGYFDLIMTAFGYEPGWEDSDTVHVDILFDAVVDAGNDTLVCINHSIQMQPVVQNVDSAMWTTAGDGTFNDPNELYAIYTPGSADIENGSVILSLYGSSADPCDGEDSDDLTLTIDECTGIDELSGRDIALEVYPNPSSGIFNLDVQSLNTEQFTLRILNIHGQQVFSGRLGFENGQYSNSLDFTYFPKGIYYVVVQGEKNSVTQRIVFK